MEIGDLLKEAADETLGAGKKEPEPRKPSLAEKPSLKDMLKESKVEVDKEDSATKKSEEEPKRKNFTANVLKDAVADVEVAKSDGDEPGGRNKSTGNLLKEAASEVQSGGDDIGDKLKAAASEVQGGDVGDKLKAAAAEVGEVDVEKAAEKLKREIKENQDLEAAKKKEEQESAAATAAAEEQAQQDEAEKEEDNDDNDADDDDDDDAEQGNECPALGGLKHELVRAVSKGDASRLRRLIRGQDAEGSGERLETSDLTELDGHGWTLLHWAASKGTDGHIKCVEELVERGVCSGSSKGWTCLSHGDELCGWTPLHIAVINGHVAMAKLLKETAANNEMKKDQHGDDPKHCIPRRRGRKALAMASSLGVDVDDESVDSELVKLGMRTVPVMEQAKAEAKRRHGLKKKQLEERRKRAIDLHMKSRGREGLGSSARAEAEEHAWDDENVDQNGRERRRCGGPPHKSMRDGKFFHGDNGDGGGANIRSGDRRKGARQGVSLRFKEETELLRSPEPERYGYASRGHEREWDHEDDSYDDYDRMLERESGQSSRHCRRGHGGRRGERRERSKEKSRGGSRERGRKRSSSRHRRGRSKGRSSRHHSRDRRGSGSAGSSSGSEDHDRDSRRHRSSSRRRERNGRSSSRGRERRSSRSKRPSSGSRRREHGHRRSSRDKSDRHRSSRHRSRSKGKRRSGDRERDRNHDDGDRRSWHYRSATDR
jgi:hypothetical protein